jgi:putative tryptophan/tyrosine transport system substrate-binding protein
MKRREFITALGGAAAWSSAARAQQPVRMPRIGVLLSGPESDPARQSYISAFRDGLAALGWTAGRNLQIDYVWNVDSPDMARAAIADMLRLKPDVLLVAGSVILTGAQQATTTTPIVFATVSEPVLQGFVASLAKPGGNITGFTNLEPSFGSKWLELLKELAPELTHVAVVFNPKVSPIAEAYANAIVAAAPNFGLRAVAAGVLDPAEIDAAMADLGREPDGGLVVPPDNFTSTHHKRLIELADRHRTPLVGWTRYWAVEGGLASYGAYVPDMFLRAASYVDRILKGTKPADLPVEQPTKYDLIINLKTAKALGITVSPALLARANEVIE